MWVGIGVELQHHFVERQIEAAISGVCGYGPDIEFKRRKGDHRVNRCQGFENHTVDFGARG